MTKILDKHLKEEDFILAHGLGRFRVCLSDTVNLGRTSRQQEHAAGVALFMMVGMREGKGEGKENCQGKICLIP